jgi:hypothetical protein
MRRLASGTDSGSDGKEIDLTVHQRKTRPLAHMRRDHKFLALIFKNSSIESSHLCLVALSVFISSHIPIRNVYATHACFMRATILTHWVVPYSIAPTACDRKYKPCSPSVHSAAVSVTACTSGAQVLLSATNRAAPRYAALLSLCNCLYLWCTRSPQRPVLKYI